MALAVKGGGGDWWESHQTVSKKYLYFFLKCVARIIACCLVQVSKSNIKEKLMRYLTWGGGGGGGGEGVRALACTGDRTVRDGFESYCGQLASEF